MRLVIEVSDAERSALRAFTQSFTPNPSYSQLFRTLLALSIEGKIHRKILGDALTAPRPSINVTLQQGITDKKPVTAHSGPMKASEMMRAQMARLKAKK